MAVNELVKWDFLPEDVKPSVYPGRTDLNHEQLTWNRVHRVFVGVKAVDENHEIQRISAERRTKLHRLTVNDQEQPDPIVGTPVEINGYERKMPDAKYLYTPTTLRPDWQRYEK